MILAYHSICINALSNSLITLLQSSIGLAVTDTSKDISQKASKGFIDTIGLTFKQVTLVDFFGASFSNQEIT